MIYRDLEYVTIVTLSYIKLHFQLYYYTLKRNKTLRNL